MRPLPGDEAFVSRQCASDTAATPTAASTSQTTYFFADEATSDAYLPQSGLQTLGFREQRRQRECDSVPPKCDIDKESRQRKHQSRSCEKDNVDADLSPIQTPPMIPRSPASSRSNAPSSVSRSMTPMMLGTPCSGSVISSPSSRRNSFTESLSDNVISVVEEAPGSHNFTTEDGPHAPQLVMPSIQMPSRRPFTEVGKHIGHFKILIAGGADTGKTSLIRAMYQSCEHIVHMDSGYLPSTTHSNVVDPPRPSISADIKSESTSRITEVHASTRPYPEWWSEIDKTEASKRRRSSAEEVVLERNLCFVDTPGYSQGPSCVEVITKVIEYVQSHLDRVHADTLSDSETISLLGGNGGAQVDLVFYLILKTMNSIDIEYLRRLSSLTNVIPVLAQADRMKPDEVQLAKQKIMAQLWEADIEPFTFFPTKSGSIRGQSFGLPYSVSSATGPDYEVIDASLLMSPDYIQPLITTELKILVDQVFSPDGTAWLRHAAARKYLKWRKDVDAQRPKDIYHPISLPSNPNSFPSSSQALLLPRVCSQLALAHTRGKANREGEAQGIHLTTGWASNLQRSMENERCQFEILSRWEKFNWPTEHITKRITATGMLVPFASVKGRRKRRTPQRTSLESRCLRNHDPLGLLQIASDIKVKGMVALEVLGGLSLLGGLALWLSSYHWHIGPATTGLGGADVRFWTGDW